MAKEFIPYTLEQRLLLPPDLRDWLPEGHLALFIADVVQELDLSAIFKKYKRTDGRGRPAYHPAMMTGLLLHAYCVGKTSSRKIEKATYEEVAFRVLAGDQHPDHDVIADFRKRNLKELSGLFYEVLQLCRQAGLVKLGHVALDGTKVRANASKHKAMSYKRMCEAERKLKEEVERLLEEAERVDTEEDAKYGKGCRGDELPEELRRRESRLKKIREAKKALEEEARKKAEKKAGEARERIKERERKEREQGRKFGGRLPQVPNPDEAKPRDNAQKNFTDPDSRIMVDKSTNSFAQAYNAQAAVDSEAQVIVAADVTQDASDKHQLVTMAEQVQQNTGRLPNHLSADSGYFSADELTDPSLVGVNLLVPPEKTVQTAEGTAMRAKLDIPENRAIYRRRKAIAEPPFGQIKAARGFRQFSLRGYENVRGEFLLVALTHNLLKLFRSGWCPTGLEPCPA
jgi:transposase